MKALFKNSQSIDLIHKTAKSLNETNVVLQDVDAESIGELMKQVGNKIGSVHFIKRSDNELRKMCFRLHVTKPRFAKEPSGKVNKKKIDQNNEQLTVFDVNKVLRDKNGIILKDENGKQKRGDWRTVPLENVTRLCIDGIVYTINQ